MTEYADPAVEKALAALVKQRISQARDVELKGPYRAAITGEKASQVYPNAKAQPPTAANAEAAKGTTSGIGEESMPDEQASDEELVAPHPEDPVQENPFPVGHPGHQVWKKATRQAERHLLRLEQRILEAQPENYAQDEELHIKLFVAKFEIWAKRGLSVVRDYPAARAYEQWLETYALSTLTMIEDKASAGIHLATFLPKLKHRLLRVSKYWSANALDNVDAIEATDAQISTVDSEGEQPSVSADISPIGSGRMASGVNGPNDNGIDRPAVVDAFLLQCNRESAVGFKARRKHIWLAAGHAHARQFQYWQQGSDKATDEDDRNFRRILSMTPAEFIALLNKKGIGPASS